MVSQKMKYCFGVDIGGTTVKLGLFTTGGEIVDKWEIKTRTENQGEAVLPDIAEALKEKLEEKKIGRDEVLKLPGTKVLMKTGRKMKAVRESILRSGQDAVMIEDCGMPSEKIYKSAEEIPEQSGYYSLIIVKEKK